MARIIIRKFGSGDPKPIAFGQPVSGDGGESSGSDTGTLRTLTGEPDNADFGTANDDSASRRGVNGNGTEFVDPTNATPASGGGKRRGRKPGSKNRVNRATPTETSKTLTTILFSLHLGMASMFKSEVFAITEDEATRLGGAITRVTELYDIPLLTDKQQAWLNLAIVGCSVYGPRIVASGVLRKKSGPRVVTMPSPIESGGVAH
jgi:hypothetical protein